MKLGLNIVGVLMALLGLVWFFQGIGVIKGSFMTGSTQWLLIGLVLIIIAAGLLFFNNRRRQSA